MPRYEVTVNGKRFALSAEPGMPLLWVLREKLGLTGAKYGCGVGSCGACTVLRGGEPVRSCLLAISEAAGSAFTTVEGLARPELHAVQKAWLEEDVAQCGYCQPAALVTAAALLAAHPRPSEAEIDAAYEGFVCRCGSWARMRRAIHRAAGGAKP